MKNAESVFVTTTNPCPLLLQSDDVIYVICLHQNPHSISLALHHPLSIPHSQPRIASSLLLFPPVELDAVIVCGITIL